MSLRSAARLTRSLRPSLAASFASSRAPAIARRYQSSGSGGHEAGSDRLWILGSAAFFIPLGAYVTFYGQDNSHHVPHPDTHQRAENAGDAGGESSVSAQEASEQQDDEGAPQQSEDTEAESKGEDNESDESGGAEDSGDAPTKEKLTQSLQQAESVAVPRGAVKDESEE